VTIDRGSKAYEMAVAGNVDDGWVASQNVQSSIEYVLDLWLACSHRTYLSETQEV
jgi:hypothetical protein